jgi:hypothetical protein
VGYFCALCHNVCRENKHYHQDSFLVRPIKTSKSEPARLVVQIASAAVTCLVYLTVVLRFQQDM